jgi:hypothetical protein
LSPRFVYCCVFFLYLRALMNAVFANPAHSENNRSVCAACHVAVV